MEDLSIYKLVYLKDSDHHFQQKLCKKDTK